MKNNKGFTIIELVIAIGITAIIVVMISLMMTTSMRTYASVSNNVKLQQDAQLALTHIQEHVVEANGKINFAGTTLTVTNQIPPDNYYSEPTDGTVYTYTLGEDNVLIFGTDTLAKDVTAFTVEINGDTVDVSIEFTRSDRVYIAEQTIALRNPIEIGT